MDTPAGAQPSELTPIFDVLNSDLPGHSLSELVPAFSDLKSLSSDGKRVRLERDKPQQIPITGDFLNGNVKINAIDLANKVSFDVDTKARTASNIDGISLSITFFDTQYSAEVKQVRLGQDKDGNKCLYTDFRNPLPDPVRRVLAMPPTISIDFPVKDGRVQQPLLSKVFADAASATGPSIGGLLTADALREGSKVALFVESNPKWINYVVEPALHDIYRALRVPKPVATGRQLGPDIAILGQSNPFVQPKGPILGQQPIGKEQLTPKDANLQNGGGGKKVEVEAVKAPPVQVGDHIRTMTIDGADRKYKIHVPPSYNHSTPMPFLIVLHGHAQNGDIIADATKMNALADRKGFIAVYPDARIWAGREEWRAWDTGNGLLPPGSSANDVAFMRSIIESAEKEFVIDKKRIFMAGLSNGGMMSFRAAGELSDKLAAIAVVSGAMGGKEPPPKFPISVMNIHGTEDRIVPYDGLKNVPASLTAIGLPRFTPTQYATNYWVEQNKITTPPLVLNNQNVTERRFMNTDTGAKVTEYTINGGGHVPNDIEPLTETIWNFFEANPKPTGEASGTAQPQEEPFNVTERIKAHIKTRGQKGVELDAGRILTEMRHLKNGSISPSASIAGFENKSGIQLSDTVSQFLKSTESITKTKDRVDITLSGPKTFAVDEGSGPVRVTGIKLDNPSFDLLSDKETPLLKNISGVSFGIHALGNDHNIGLTEIAQKVDGNGEPYYQLKARHPMGSLCRNLLLADSEIPVDLKLNADGTPRLLNRRGIKDSTLGVNPLTRGYMDIASHGYNAFNSPGWGSIANLGKDGLIMGGSGYGAYRLGAMKFTGKGGKVGMAVAGTLIVAPIIIHGVERLIGE